MSLAENKLLPLRSVGPEIAQSRRSQVARTGSHVVKSNNEVYDLPVVSGETNERELRMQRSTVLIREEQQKEREAKEFLPSGVWALREHHFIGHDEDGLPAPYRVQRHVGGQTLRNIDIDRLDDHQLAILALLIKGSLRVDQKYGKHLDVTGVLNNDPKGIRALVRIFYSVRSSVNLLLTTDGRIGFVDAKTAEYGTKSWKSKVAKVTLLSGFLLELARINFSLLTRRAGRRIAVVKRSSSALLER